MDCIINHNDAYNSGNSVVNNLSAHSIALIGESDVPILIKGTGNEDYKRIIIRDKNDAGRYLLIFSGGKLKFISYDSNGSLITEKYLA